MSAVPSSNYNSSAGLSQTWYVRYTASLVSDWSLPPSLYGAVYTPRHLFIENIHAQLNHGYAHRQKVVSPNPSQPAGNATLCTATASALHLLCSTVDDKAHVIQGLIHHPCCDCSANAEWPHGGC
ncbi:hypothetical protein BDW68DRAFT_157649 [Aspergillus falconensis]